MKVKKISSYILSILLILLVLIMIILKISDIKTYSMVSKSMEPALKIGNLIFNQKEDFQDIKKGDIITYKMKDSSIHVTHRVSEKEEEGKRILCKGDANRDVDGAFIDYETQYEGTLLFYLPYIGYGVTFMQSTLGKIMSILIVSILLIDIVYDIYKRRNKKSLRSS